MKKDIEYIIQVLFYSFILFSISFCIVCIFLFQGLLKGICLGIGGGVLFSLGMTLFSVYLTKWVKNQRDELAGAGIVLFDGAANHLNSGKAVGGWIFLTQDSFLYKAHKFNGNVYEYKVLYSDIQEVMKSNSLRTICIRLKSGETESFIVNKRHIWIKIINQYIENQKTGHSIGKADCSSEIEP